MSSLRFIINRYLFKEILLSFLLILTIVTLVLILGRIFQIVDLIMNKGVSILEVVGFIFLLFPSLLLYSLPMSLLFAILVTLSRFSSDNELTIMKTSGMSLYQISLPIFLVAVLVFFISLLNSYVLLPQGNLKVRQLMYHLACKKATVGIVEKTFNDDFSGIILYADRVPASGDFLEGVFISDFRQGSQPIYIISQKAFLIGDSATMSVILRMKDGSIHMPDRPIEKYRRLDFKQYDVKLNFGPSLAADLTKKASREMTVKEIKGLLEKSNLEDSEKRELEMELYERLSIPFSAIFFALVAIPMGIKKHHAAKYRGFMAGLILVLAYYVFRGWGLALGETGRIPPLMGAWLPNILIGMCGVYLILISAQESSPGQKIKMFLRRNR
ncbi:MAG: LPS export ABC transporter permease LptF [Syntrophales bacterium]|nr:LPS export ABC transporter permease LptF [Syntrophales bacterium]